MSAQRINELAKHYKLTHQPRKVFCQCGVKLWDSKEAGDVVMLSGLTLGESLHVAHQVEALAMLGGTA